MPISSVWTAPIAYLPDPTPTPTTWMETYVGSNLQWLFDNKASLAGAAFTGAVSTSSTLGVTGNSVLSTASLSGALTLAVELILTGLGSPPSAPAAGKGSLYLDSSLIPKVRTNSTTYTIPYLELANTFTAAQIITNTLTMSGTGSNIILNTTAPQNRDIMFQTGGVNSAIIRLTNDARSGADAGDNFGINLRTDAGASKSWPFYAERTTGFVMINGTTPTAQLDVNGNTLRLRTNRTPANSAAAGNQGDICWDDTYIYVRNTTQWKRTPALSTF